MIRVGELLPNAPPIRHVLKVGVNARENVAPCSAPGECFRWPARWADSFASVANEPNKYGGGISAMKMGALLAIPSTTSIDSLGLVTEPARRLAFTLQNYGAYVVANPNYSAFTISVEWSEAGRVVDEFKTAWGFDLDETDADKPWSQDFIKLMNALRIVDNNAVGSVGGGGQPLQPAAPPLSP